MTTEEFDKACNEGFRKLEQLRAEDKVKTPEYDAQLKKLKELTEKRKQSIGLVIKTIK